MIDLVKRLRTMAATGWNPIGDEAADEITHLRAEVERLEREAMTDIVERLRLIELIEQLRQAALTRDDYRWEAADTITALRARVKALEEGLGRARTILGNMALENEGATFNRWPINHEPLRVDARNLLPVIDAALEEKQ